MSWLITLIIGGVLGALFGWAMDTNYRVGIWQNVFFGMIGSILGYWLFVDVLHLGVMNTRAGYFSGIAFLWEIIGSIVFLVIISMIFGYRGMASIERRRHYGQGVAREYEEKHDRDRDDKYR